MHRFFRWIDEPQRSSCFSPADYADELNRNACAAALSLRVTAKVKQGQRRHKEKKCAKDEMHGFFVTI